MTHHIQTSILIHASPSEIWKVLTDFNQYPDWNPFIRSIEGDFDRGGRIKADLDGMTFKPTILKIEDEREFTWLGHLWIKGLFDGRHTFVIENHRDGTCTFHQDETFTGLLVGMLKSKLENETKEGFIRMNEALKKRVEGK